MVLLARRRFCSLLHSPLKMCISQNSVTVVTIRWNRRREVYRDGLISDPSQARSFDDVYRRGGPDSSHTKTHHVQQVVDSPHPTCSFDLDAAFAVLSHQFQVGAPLHHRNYTDQCSV